MGKHLSQLSGCTTYMWIEYFVTVDATQEKYYTQMHPTDHHYLMQYPAARCSMGTNVCKYGHSASSGAESMNNANDLAR
jgi:hypothetical protein